MNDLISEGNGKISSQSHLRIVSGSTRVQKFFIKGKPYTQLSDHYGISIDLEYVESFENDDYYGDNNEST